MVLYHKISSLTSRRTQAKDLGTITNLLSNQLIVEYRLASLLFSSIFPLIVIGILVILIIRIGWAGIVGTRVLIFVPYLAIKSSPPNSETSLK